MAPGRWCGSWRGRIRRVRCIRRVGRRGLSGACIEGILASSAPYAAVIDADLQHDETQLPKMLALLQSGEAELVVGSRYIEGWQGRRFQQAARRRQRACHRSRQARAEGQGRRSHERLLHDPPRPLRATGAATCRPRASRSCSTSSRPRTASCARWKFPYTFGARLHGESKLDSMVALDFLGLVLAKLTNDVITLRFMLFAHGRRARPARASRDAVHRARGASTRRLPKRRRPAPSSP